MGTVTKTIGTASRDYSTIAAWEADLDNTGIYSAADDAVGECYADSTFSAGATINGGGTVGLTSSHVTAASGEEHDGTAGTGVVISANATYIIRLFYDGSTYDVARYISLLEIKRSTGTGSWGGIAVDANYSTTDHKAFTLIHRMLIHDITATGSFSTVAGIETINHGDYTATNTIVYAINNNHSGGTGDSYGAFGITSATVNPGQGHDVLNCTVHLVENDQDGTARGMYDLNAAATNNIVTDTGGSTTEAKTDYNSITTPSYNISSDATASGTGSHTSESSSSLFVSTTPGSEDLHLASGATNAIDGGTDLGTSPWRVNIDIDGRDRDAEADTWDIGADERVAAGGATGHINLPLMGVG